MPESGKYKIHRKRGSVLITGERILGIRKDMLNGSSLPHITSCPRKITAFNKVTIGLSKCKIF